MKILNVQTEFELVRVELHLEAGRNADGNPVQVVSYVAIARSTKEVAGHNGAHRYFSFNLSEDRGRSEIVSIIKTGVGILNNDEDFEIVGAWLGQP